MDIWVVRYSVNDIKTRLKFLVSFEPHELRAWMFHCGNETFQRTIKLKNENRNAREPFADDEAYLCHRLNIAPETVEDLYQRHPPLRCVQTTKLRAILDYLFAEGFQSIDICRSPRILCHSLLTIKERIDHMKSLGYRPQSLAVCLPCL
ncbi:transcription termination factor, mitochondrial-like [Nilaparvata lugens]|uniref:transcription termination factor, mitochondrial-like n=1 Tax=Nilaparvata lugens TaxID=108931 RepID=UPI00193CE209|nr:transcription termination factor, mitochondrial-like [Nilaparvata lugens]